MNLDFFKSDKSLSNTSNSSKSFIRELTAYLNNYKSNLSYRLDRLEGDFAILQNRETLDIFNIKKNKIPKSASDGCILKIVNNHYVIDYDAMKQSAAEIQNSANAVISKSSDLYIVNHLQDDFAICENIRTHSIHNFPYYRFSGNIEVGAILEFENGRYKQISS